MDTNTGDRVSPAAPRTVAALLGQTVRRHPERPALRFAGVGAAGDTDAGAANAAGEASGGGAAGSAAVGIGEVRPLSWLEVGLLVVEAGRWLVEQGRPSPISLVMPPSPASWVLEMAGLIAGCSINPVYDDAPVDELNRVLGLVAPRLVAVDATTANPVRASVTARALAAEIVDVDQLFSVWRERAGAQTRRHGLSGFESAPVLEALGALSLEGEQRQATALLLQSTGTTGPAKIIELPSRALLDAAWAVRESTPHRHPRYLAFLPSGHISHQLINVFAATLLAGEVCFGHGVTELIADLRRTRPTVLFGSPLIYRGVHAKVAASLSGTRAGRAMAARIERAKQGYLRTGIIGRGTAPLSGRLVGRKVARSMGLDQVRDFFSGTSPLDAETHAFFASLGWFVRNTYGLSECGGAATVSRRDWMTVAELGQPVEGIEMRQDTNGQLLVRGQSMMTGFLNGPPVARPGTDGWLGTGDLVDWDSDNNLTFVGRVSSRIRAPGVATTLDALEAAVEAAHPGVQAVVVNGDDKLSLLVFAAPGTSAPTATLTQFLLAQPAATGFGLVQAVGVVPTPLSAERGELGPTGKVRRWRVRANWVHVLEPVNTGGAEMAEELSAIEDAGAASASAAPA